MRKVYQFMIILSILSLLMIPLSASAGKKKPQPPGPPGPEPEPCNSDITITEVLNMSNTGFFLPEQGIIEDGGTWCDYFWDKLYAMMWPKPPCDTTLVDFDNEIAIYVALGQRSNGCYGVDITCVTKNGTNLEIDYDEIVPGKGCFCPDMVVAPVDVVKIDKDDYIGIEEVEFQHHIRVRDCL